MRYRHPGQLLRDPGGGLRAALAEKKHSLSLDPAYRLGLIGGEMARRMVEAALAYLSERAAGEVGASFARAVYGDTGRDAVTTTGPKS